DLWDATTGAARTQPFKFAHHLRRVRLSRDGRWLVACGGDGTARVWDVSLKPNLDLAPWKRDCGQAHVPVEADGSTSSPDGKTRLRPGKNGGVLEFPDGKRQVL